MPHRLQIRPAEVGDISMIMELMAPQVAAGVLLPRSEDDVCQHLQEFVVGTYDGQPAGVATLHLYTRHLAEIRSLVVADDYRHLGVGRLLVEACEQLAMQRGVDHVFALTYVKDFFIRQGYKVVAKESLPHKIWTVCIHCEKFHCCDETAVEKHLKAAHSKPILERLQP